MDRIDSVILCHLDRPSQSVPAPVVMNDNEMYHVSWQCRWW